MKKNDLTIIVPIYRIEEEYLRECIESILNQKNDNIHTILIDDGSPDNCGAICDEYQKKNKNIKVIHQKNSGVSYSRNIGIEHSNTKWTTFVDPDDYVSENTYNKILDFLNNNDDIDILMYPYETISKNNNYREKYSDISHSLTKEEIKECQIAPFYKLLQNNKSNNYSITALWNKIYKTDFLKNNNCRFVIEAKKGQDRLFNAKAFSVAENVYYYNDGLYLYRHYSDSITNKFNCEIVKLTIIEINELKRINEELNLGFSRYINARLCTRLFSCMRLYFFHKDNTNSWKEKVKEVNETINNYNIDDAIKNVDWKLLDIKEKIFVICIKYRLYRLCSVLIDIYNLKNK